MKLYFEVKQWKIIPLFTKEQLVDGKYFMQQVKQIRTLPQNRLYFWYYLKYIVATYKDYWYIYTKDTLHNIFKKAFIPRERIYSDFSKKYIQKTWSTTKMKTKQFSTYLECIKVIFEFWEMEQLWLPKIDSFVIPDINEEQLLEWESKII